MKLILKKFVSIIFGLLIGLIICEIALHIYNPFPFAISKGKMVLPSNQKITYHNTWINSLDSNIYYSKNSLGFRGPEPSNDVSKLLSLICIGGSTTECKFISDSLTWPYQLSLQLKDSLPNIWVNNAGIDGHSTFGHLLLLHEYIARLRPKYVAILIGINDVETNAPLQFDLMNEKKINFTSTKSFLKSAANKTILGATLFQLYAVRGAYKKGLIHKQVNFETLGDTTFSTLYKEGILAKQNDYLAEYKKRIIAMLAICKQSNVTPILLTQPSLFGNYTDSATMIQMGNKIIPNTLPITNANLMQQVLNKYNAIVKSFESEVKVIDLAALMPKNSLYYYDFIHFTNTGCLKVAQILNSQMLPILKEKH